MRKKVLKIIVCICLFSLLISISYCTSSKKVTVGEVGGFSYTKQETIYDVEISWGDMIFNYVTKEYPDGQKYYDWEPNRVCTEENPNVMDSGSVTVTNKSTVAVNMDVLFTSNMQYVTGIQNDRYSYRAEQGYKALSEMPEDWTTGTYYVKEDDTYNFTAIPEGTEFIAGEYYEIYGMGAAPYTSSEIAGVTEDYEGIIYLESLT